MIKSVCVYCASSPEVDPFYLDMAKNFGKLLALNNIRCVYGAGSVGLMGSLAEGVLSSQGKITGIIPQFMCEREWDHKNLSELIIVDSMHERKELMMRKADAVAALPGGIGTFEELVEAITWKKLGLFHGHIFIVNANNYYQDLIKMLEKAIDEKFMDEEDRDLWTVVNTPEEFLHEIKSLSETSKCPTIL